MPELAEALRGAALLCSAAGVVTAVTVLAGTGRGLLALRCALELWLAAGLLRLAADPGWAAIVVAGTIVAVRRLAAIGLAVAPPPRDAVARP